MISYRTSIRRRRLEIIISYIDDDGEFNHSTRQPIFRFYGYRASEAHLIADHIPQSIDDPIDSDLFAVIAEFKLFKPSFIIIDSIEYMMMFNLPFNNEIRFNANLSAFPIRIGQAPETTAHIVFARITNAKPVPEELVHLDVGDFSSMAAIKINQTTVHHLDELVFVNHTIVEH